MRPARLRPQHASAQVSGVLRACVIFVRDDGSQALGYHAGERA